MIDDVQMVDGWLKRMNPFIEEFTAQYQDKISEDLGPIRGMNNRLRICKYPAGGIFGKHEDAEASFASFRSRFTVMAYLNNISEEQGGATRFFEKTAMRPLAVKIQPAAGLVVIFPHQLLHDGELCIADAKYLIRSDIMFDR